MKTQKIIFWLPRILAILFILFISLFALDVFDLEAPWHRLLGGFLMHLIPSFILLAVLIASWKNGLAAGIIFPLFGCLYIFMTLKSGIPWYIALSWSLTIAFPAIFIGGLFLWPEIKRKKEDGKR